MGAFPHHGQGRKAEWIRELKKRKRPGLLIFVERHTSKSRVAHEPFEDVRVAGEE